MVLTVSFVLSPVIGLFVTVACGVASANLTPASRRQEHTTSPSASVRFVKRTARVHRIPSHVRDDRETPLRGTGPNRNSPVSTWPSSEISEIPKLVRNPCKVRPDNRLSIPKASTSVFSFTGRPRRRYDSDKRRPSNCTTCEPADCIELGNSHLGAFTLLCPRISACPTIWVRRETKICL